MADVSVPRRGFVVFLHRIGVEEQVARKVLEFQSPEGDSLFFYPEIDVRLMLFKVEAFQSPEGDSLFFYGFSRQYPSYFWYLYW